MTTPDVRQAYDSDVMLTRTQYGELYGYKDRTMQRYLADGRIPGAVKDERGQWLIPAGAPVLAASASTSVVRQAAPDTPSPTSGVRLADALAVLPALVDAATLARLLGISEHAVNEHRDELDGRRWGRTWVYPLRVVRELAGIVER